MLGPEWGWPEPYIYIYIPVYCIWPYIWWFQSQKYQIYTVYRIYTVLAKPSPEKTAGTEAGTETKAWYQCEVEKSGTDTKRSPGKSFWATHASAYTQLRAHICIHIHTYAHMHKHTHTRLYSVPITRHTHLHTHTHSHTHTHTHAPPPLSHCSALKFQASSRLKACMMQLSCVFSAGRRLLLKGQALDKASYLCAYVCVCVFVCVRTCVCVCVSVCVYVCV